MDRGGIQDASLLVDNSDMREELLFLFLIISPIRY